MGKKGKLFKKGVSYIIERAVRKIDQAKDEWANATIEGFRTDWNVWLSQYIEPSLRSLVARLPPKTADIRTNVLNRVVPVATLISSQSKRYKLAKITMALPVPAPAVPAPVPAPVAR
jgi:hypothetical protein